MKPNQNTAPKVVEDCHELLEWIIPKLDQFPRNRRFTHDRDRRSHLRRLGFAVAKPNKSAAN